MAKTHAVNHNMGVEYVLIFRFSATGQQPMPSFTVKRLC
jgi:hypothetical protein